MSTAPVLAAPDFDPALITRYDVAGPRYTSYPTAPQFHAGFGELDLRAQAQASNEEPIPRALSLYVHVPFCTSPCFYCGCTRIITRDHARADVYLEHLQREIELAGALFDRDRHVVQLHFGGGTPNFLDTAQMARLMGQLGRHFSFAPPEEREFGIEMDPRWADASSVRALAGLGFNRLSVGVQDFDPAVQAAVNRIQGFEVTRDLIAAARDAGFASVSMDLIYGLPLQTADSFRRTLEQVLAIRPDRIAAYSYAHLPELFKPQRQLDASLLPSAAEKLALFGITLQTLTAAGYVYIGMDHFALPDDELARAQREGSLQRNFQGYSTHGDCDIVGLGMSAIGRIGDAYSQNVKELPVYYAMLDDGRLPIARGLLLSEDDRIRRELIMELMCHDHLDMDDFGRRHGIDFATYFGAALQRVRQLAADGLVTIEARRIVVTARGRLLLRNIAMCFDAYLGVAGPRARYSRAI